MKLIPDRIKELWRRTPRACIIATVAVLLLATTMSVIGWFKGAKYAGALTMVVLYFLHLAIGAGAGFTILRLWYYRDNPLIKRMGVYMFAAPIGALTSIVLLFMARGVVLTWKFSITLFAGTLIADLMRLSFIPYMLRGSDPRAIPAPPPSSADVVAPR